MKLKAFTIIFFLLVPAYTLYGQVRTTDRYPQYGNTRDEQRRRNLDADRRRRAMQGDDRRFGITTNRRIQKNGVWRRIIPFFSDEVREKLKVSEVDRDIFRDFLAQPKTGITKFLTADIKKCRKTDVRCAQQAVDILTYGTSYSFREEQFRTYQTSDLSLVKGDFVLQGTNIQGLLVELGNIPLEELDSTAEEIKLLMEFKPEADLEKAAEQYRSIEKGLNFKNKKYSRKASARLNQTYALRSIAYRNSRHIGVAQGLDVIVVFRAIRQDEEGNWTIVWKELSRMYAPELKVAH